MIQIINILNKFGLDITHVDIKERYDESHRYYHIFKHIEFLIERINNLFEKGLINDEERDILILTALFHDIVYNPQKTDNELQSVNLLKSKVFDNMTPELEKVCEIILATSSHKKTGDKLTDIFCDLDMWFLTNGTFVEIAEDEKNIFKEYQFVDYNTYKKERIQFLESTLDNYGKPNEKNLRLLIEYIKNRIRDKDGYLSIE